MFSHDDVLDAGLNVIATATTVTVCSAQPADHAGIAAVALADATISGTDFGTIISVAGGRSLPLNEVADILIDTSGTATHIAYSGGGKLLHVKEGVNQALVANASNTVTIAASTVKFNDPTNV